MGIERIPSRLGYEPVRRKVRHEDYSVAEILGALCTNLDMGEVERRQKIGDERRLEVVAELDDLAVDIARGRIPRHVDYVFLANLGADIVELSDTCRIHVEVVRSIFVEAVTSHKEAPYLVEDILCEGHAKLYSLRKLYLDVIFKRGVDHATIP